MINKAVQTRRPDYPMRDKLHSAGDASIDNPRHEQRELHVTVIEPARNWPSLNLDELWRYRDLFFLLIWRDLVGRYRQSIVGIGWSVIKPVVSMMIFSFIFGHVAGIKSDGPPYPLFVFCALLPWMYFSNALLTATASVVNSGGLLQKVYFPRLVLPLVGIVAGLMELIIQLVVMTVLMIWYQHLPGWQVVLFPVFILFAASTALAVGLWLTALNVKYRDVGQAMPFVTQAWMWLSPVIISSNSVPAALRPIYDLNPMVGVIEGFRWCFLGSPAPDWRMMMFSVGTVGILLIGGLFYFRRTEASFADVI